MKTKRTEIEHLLIVANTSDSVFKFPIGNEKLVEQLKQHERKGIIFYNTVTRKWEFLKRIKKF